MEAGIIEQVEVVPASTVVNKMGIGRPEKNPIKSGERFGILTAQSIGKPAYSKRGYPIKRWLCQCDCGNRSTVRTQALRTGNTKSCGCGETANLKEIAGKRKHGHSAGGTVSPEFRAWCKRIEWCYDANCPDYPNYGGRGITVAQEWRESFLVFYGYVGPRPSPAHSLDRINNDGNYEPGNVRWATIEQQARNRRNNHSITYKGETHCVAEWAEVLQINKQVLYTRIALGWEGDKLFQPQLFFKRKTA